MLLMVNPTAEANKNKVYMKLIFHPEWDLN